MSCQLSTGTSCQEFHVLKRRNSNGNCFPEKELLVLNKIHRCADPMTGVCLLSFMVWSLTLLPKLGERGSGYYTIGLRTIASWTREGKGSPFEGDVYNPLFAFSSFKISIVRTFDCFYIWFEVPDTVADSSICSLKSSCVWVPKMKVITFEIRVLIFFWLNFWFLIESW